MTKQEFYLQVAEKTAEYVLSEMTSPGGGFYSAQDADAQGKEGGFYLLTPGQVGEALGPDQAAAFCRAYDVTEQGHLAGGSIPNLLTNPYWDRPWKQAGTSEQVLEQARQTLKRYRKQRMELHLDDKILTGWNALMILAMTALHRQTKQPRYLQAAQNARQQIEQELYQDGRLYVGLRDRRRSGQGFLDDYAGFALALLGLHQATLCSRDLELAIRLTETAVELFYDEDGGGFYTTAWDQEKLLFRSKQVYDGAIPSGNSIMAYLLVRLWQVTGQERFHALAQAQLAFLERSGGLGQSFYLTAKLQYEDPAPLITVVLSKPEDRQEALDQLPANAVLRVLEEPDESHPRLNGRLTFYVCQNRSCQPPVNKLP